MSSPENKKILITGIGASILAAELASKKADMKDIIVLKGDETAEQIKELLQGEYGKTITDIINRDNSYVIEAPIPYSYHGEPKGPTPAETKIGRMSKIEIIREYELIKEKKSQLSRKERDLIVERYNSQK